MEENVFVVFDSVLKDLSILIGGYHLNIEGFVDCRGGVYKATISKQTEEKLIKALIGNINLK